MYYEITNLLTRGLDLAGGQSIWRETWVIMTDADATVDKYLSVSSHCWLSLNKIEMYARVILISNLWRRR
jgi:hypothetical protein